MKPITKSVRLGSSRIMQEFIAKQKNFSESVRFLIFDYCNRNGISDLSENYTAMVENLIMKNSPIVQIEMPVMDNPLLKSEAADKVDKAAPTKLNQEVPKPEKISNSQNVDDIPDCYK